MEIRKSKPPKHTPELLQKAEAAVQSAFFGIRDAISAQRKKMQQKPLPKSEPESKPVSSMAHKVSSWNPDEESLVPHVVPAQRRRIRYDRILLTALLCCLIVFLCIYAFKCSTQSDKPQMLAANTLLSPQRKKPQKKRQLPPQQRFLRNKSSSGTRFMKKPLPW